MVGELLVRLFKNAGHEVEHVTDGLDAYQKLSEDLGRFDVLVTDQNLPGLKGHELIELIRQTDFAGKIIVHAAELAAAERDRLRTLRVDHTVLKSSPPEELLAVVEALYGGE